MYSTPLFSSFSALFIIIFLIVPQTTTPLHTHTHVKQKRIITFVPDAEPSGIQTKKKFLFLCMQKKNKEVKY